jgi:hypothetical protein
MEEQQMSAITIGAPVRTSDGKELGKVKEVLGECFKVDAPMQPDYWLGMDTVTGNSTDGGLNLRFDRKSLDSAKQEGSEHSGYHRHT